MGKPIDESWSEQLQDSSHWGLSSLKKDKLHSNTSFTVSFKFHYMMFGKI